MTAGNSQQQHQLQLTIQKQPTDSTCGHTCLHAVYDYWHDGISLATVIDEIGQLPDGGTLGVQLACHALSRGYQATICTYNLLLFDPTWFNQGEVDLRDKLSKQCEAKSQQDPRIRLATEAYLHFLDLGGRIEMQPLEEQLIVRSLNGGVPILCGLSATFLYQESRERASPPVDGKSSEPDDIGGEPVGHFVVLSGYQPTGSQVSVADPMAPDSFGNRHVYQAPLTQVAAAILLGIATYDANMMMIQPPAEPNERWHKNG